MSQRSQTDFLQEALGWTRDTCLRQLSTTVPKIIETLENAFSFDHKMKALQVLCESILPALETSDMNDHVFKNMKYVQGLLDDILANIIVTLQSASKDRMCEEVVSVLEENLQLIQEIGCCLEACLQRVSTAKCIELHHIISLPGPVLHFLQHVYKHCQDSSLLYGDFLDILSTSMSSVFKKAHSLQMSLIGLLDKTVISGVALEDHVSLLCSVCKGLFDVCTIVTSLDIKLSISLWKCISRLSSQHLELLHNRLDVCPFLNFLCAEIKNGYLYLFQLSPQAGPESLSQGDDKAFSKAVRILGFQMKVVVALIRDFADYMGESESSILDLLLCIHRSLPPCLTAISLPPKQEAEIQSQVVNATVPILTHLVGSRAFRVVLTRRNNEPTDPEDKLPLLLIQLMVMDILPKSHDDVIDQWLQPIQRGKEPMLLSLWNAVFASAGQCDVEMKLPVMLLGVTAAGQPHRQVNLYEHTVTHICGLIGACPTRHFKTLEGVLLEHAVGNSYTLSLMAVDCWAFLVRYGTAAVCKSQVHALISVYEKLVSRPMSSFSRRAKLAKRLGHLLSRIIKFMAPEDQAAVMHNYTPEQHVNLWLELKPSNLAPDLAVNICKRLLLWCTDQLSQNSIMASKLDLILQLLNEIFLSNNKTKATTESCLSQQQLMQLLQTVLGLWDQFDDLSSSSASKNFGQTKKRVVQLIPVTFHLLHMMEAKDLLQILQPLKNYLDSDHCSPNIVVKIAQLMSGFSLVNFGSSHMDCQVLEILPGLFHQLLIYPNPLVHQLALASFCQFASCTKHENIVPASLMDNDALMQDVQSYINQVSCQPLGQNFDLLTYLKEEEKRISGKELLEKPKDPCSQDNESVLEIGQDSGDEDLFEEKPSKKRRYNVIESDEENSQQDTVRNEVNTENATGVQNPLQPTTEQKITTENTTTEPYVQLQSLLGKITTLAEDITKTCGGFDTLPEWFLEKAEAELTKCKQGLKLSKCVWFDNLS